MKRLLTILLLMFSVAALNNCTPLENRGESQEKRELIRIGEALGLDLSDGTLIHFENSHGGFHGDGLTEAEVDLKGMAEKLEGASGWKPLPMTENAAQAFQICAGEDSRAVQGWYFLYDRHSESTDPYDDTELHSRFSWNFTLAVYDNQQERMYFYKLDT